MIELNKVYDEDCRDTMKRMEDNSVDSIVTDPPYELTSSKNSKKGFMGKEWDGTGIAFDPDLWRECLRVLKPGGYLLAFGGTRTQHRMVCAIEDAGFEIRDTILWIYGCLSDDTEILTKKGWIQYHKSKDIINFVNEEILIYDIQNDIYKWEKPQKWNEYSVHKDTAYRIQSDNTDQIVSRNHRCLVEREGNLVFIQAERLSDVENMPTLPDSIFELQERQSDLLQLSMQRILQRAGLEEMGKDRFRYFKSESKIKRQQWGKESGMERWSNLFQKTRQLCSNKICQMSKRISSYGSQRRLCYGTSSNSSTGVGQMSFENGNNSSYRPQSSEQRFIQSNVLPHQSGTQDLRGSKSYNITKATITPIEYSGIIFCPTVSTGAFVARRNGKIFITGNSGFPKSLDIGKAIDKEHGIKIDKTGNGERKTINAMGNGLKNRCNICGKPFFSGNPCMCDRKYDAQNEYEGWGTALKPACEMICMARKPLSESTVAKNVLKHGTGGINIDGCRIETDEDQRRPASGGDNGLNGTSTFKIRQRKIEDQKIQGRFPANVILDGSDEVLQGFPNTKSGDCPNGFKGEYSANIYGTFANNQINPDTVYADQGSAARFFYVAKADQGERQDGCHEMQKKPSGMVSNTSGQHLTRRDGGAPAPKGNNHPTVKPIKLMQYLQRMVTPKGGLTYDPFGGSGTSALSASNEGFKWILSELSPEYADIATKRIYNNNGLFL